MLKSFGKAAVATLAVVIGMKLIFGGNALEQALPGLGLPWIALGILAVFFGYFLGKKRSRK